MDTQNKIKILVVDDSLTMRILIKKALVEIGYNNIHQAPNGTKAWELIEESANNNDQYSLIVSDLNMPPLNGFELLQKIRGNDETKGLKFVMLTGEADPVNKHKAIRYGADDVTFKPFKMCDLKVKLDSILS